MLPCGIPERKGFEFPGTLWFTFSGWTAMTIDSACASQTVRPRTRANSMGTVRLATTRTALIDELLELSVNFFDLTSQLPNWISDAASVTDKPSALLRDATSIAAAVPAFRSE